MGAENIQLVPRRILREGGPRGTLGVEPRGILGVRHHGTRGVRHHGILGVRHHGTRGEEPRGTPGVEPRDKQLEEGPRRPLGVCTPRTVLLEPQGEDPREEVGTPDENS